MSTTKEPFFILVINYAEYKILVIIGIFLFLSFPSFSHASSKIPFFLLLNLIDTTLHFFADKKKYTKF